MKLQITPENQEGVLSTYHGFHDAEVSCIAIRTLRDCLGIDVDIRLIARNHATGAIDHVSVHLERIVDFKLEYVAAVDYPCIRDEVAIGCFDGLFFVDFGSASEPRYTAEEYRKLSNYFACNTIVFEVQIGPAGVAG